MARGIPRPSILEVPDLFSLLDSPRNRFYHSSNPRVLAKISSRTSKIGSSEEVLHKTEGWRFISIVHENFSKSWEKTFSFITHFRQFFKKIVSPLFNHGKIRISQAIDNAMNSNPNVISNTTVNFWNMLHCAFHSNQIWLPCNGSGFYVALSIYSHSRNLWFWQDLVWNIAFELYSIRDEILHFFQLERAEKSWGSF